MTELKDRKGISYYFPDKKIAHGSGNATHASILISQSILCLCQILIGIKNSLDEGE